MTYNYTIEIYCCGQDYQKQEQCLANSFDEAWDIARLTAKRIGGKVIELWGGK